MLNHYTATPAKDGGESRHSLLAKHLVNFGWEATLITASVSHPSGKQRLNGWKFVRREETEGYSAFWLRVPGYKGNGVRRAAGMLFFGLLSLVPGIFPGIKKPDVVLGSAVHHFAALSALFLARRYRVPFVFEVRDVWPDVLVDFQKLKEKGLFTWLIRKVSRYLCRHASMVLSPLPEISRWVQELGVKDKRVLWVSNGTDLSYLPEVLPFPPQKPFVFLYLGSFGNINAVEELVKAFTGFMHVFPDLECQLRLVGEGWKKDQLRDFVESENLKGLISIEEALPKEIAMRETQKAHCLVLPIRDAITHEKYGISPNKLFDYLLAGRPILFLGSDPIDLVQKAGAGVSAQLKDSQAIINGMKKIASAREDELMVWGENGRALAIREFTFYELSRKLAKGLDSIAS